MTKKNIKITAILAGFFAAVVLLGAQVLNVDAAFAAGAPSGNISATQVQPGESLTATVTGDPYGRARIEVYSAQGVGFTVTGENISALEAASAWFLSADESGVAVFSINVAADSPSGILEVVLASAGGGATVTWTEVLNANVTVGSGAPAGEPAPAEPDFGRGSSSLAEGATIAAGSAVDVAVDADPGQEVLLQVTIPGASIPGIQVAGSNAITHTANAEGIANFRVTIPAGTPAGPGVIVGRIGTDPNGPVVFIRNFMVAGRTVHPAAG